MSCARSSLTRFRLDSAIRALCPIIEERISARATDQWSEYELRRELVGCILGSQVRQQMAVAATTNVECAGLLDDSWWCRAANDDFGLRLFDVLSCRRPDLPHSGRHRFARTRARQLNQTRNILARNPLATWLAEDKTSRHLRQTLVAEIPGVGPKQASMFLRNVGRSYDLAILDTHVLGFMDIQDLLPIDQARIGTVVGYERAERVVIDYAGIVGYRVGYLDWAIWATMKAAREIGL